MHTHTSTYTTQNLSMCAHQETVVQMYKRIMPCTSTSQCMCAPEGPEPTHDASFSLYKDLLLLAGREAGPERWLLFTEPVPTLKEAQLDFLRVLLRGRKGGQGRGSMKNDLSIASADSTSWWSTVQVDKM